jgi:hypothetical protein
MNTQTQEALKMAIEALGSIHNQLLENGWRGLQDYEAQALHACKEALNIANCDLKQPVAWMNDIAFSMDKELLGTRSRIVPLYTHFAPAKEFVTLTDDEIFDLRKDDYGVPSKYWDDYARAIEAKLKEKNNG